MSDSLRFATNDVSFTELLTEMKRHLDPAAELPDWPFLAPYGYVTFFEYDRLLGGAFGKVLEALAQEHGDRTVTVVGLDPPVAYYRDAYGFLPGFRISADSVRKDYAVGMRHEPAGDPTGALAFTVNILGIVGSSCCWAVWGQRDWEIGLLLTSRAEGPWLHQSVPWFDAKVDLDSIRSPAGWGVALDEQQRSQFWQKVRERGSGPSQPR